MEQHDWSIDHWEGRVMWSVTILRNRQGRVQRSTCRHCVWMQTTTVNNAPTQSCIGSFGSTPLMISCIPVSLLKEGKKKMPRSNMEACSLALACLQRIPEHNATSVGGRRIIMRLHKQKCRPMISCYPRTRNGAGGKNICTNLKGVDSTAGCAWTS